jgi:hypothetical protein
MSRPLPIAFFSMATRIPRTRPRAITRCFLKRLQKRGAVFVRISIQADDFSSESNRRMRRKPEGSAVIGELPRLIISAITSLRSRSHPRQQITCVRLRRYPRRPPSASCRLALPPFTKAPAHAPRAGFRQAPSLILVNPIPAPKPSPWSPQPSVSSKNSLTPSTWAAASTNG